MSPSFRITITTPLEEYRRQVQDNPGAGATKPHPGKEIGQPIIFDIILDISVSMADFYDDLVDSFNTLMIPSLREASKRYKGGLRVGCLLFSGELVPAWVGFKTLDELGANPLKRQMLNHPNLQSNTALFGAMRAGLLWTAAAMQHMHKEAGHFPKGNILVLTDGANNCQPTDASAIRNAFNEIGEKFSRNITATVGFFKTDDGLTREQFNAMIAQTGFSGGGFHEIANGKNIHDRRASFRHEFGIWSRERTCPGKSR